MSQTITEEIEALQERLDNNKKNIEEINEIQEYLMQKINNTRYSQTTMSRQDTTDFLLELTLNWINFEMDKRKLSHNIL